MKTDFTWTEEFEPSHICRMWDANQNLLGSCGVSVNRPGQWWWRYYTMSENLYAPSVTEARQGLRTVHQANPRSTRETISTVNRVHPEWQSRLEICRSCPSEDPKPTGRVSSPENLQTPMPGKPRRTWREDRSGINLARREFVEMYEVSYKVLGKIWKSVRCPGEWRYELNGPKEAVSRLAPSSQIAMVCVETAISMREEREAAQKAEHQLQLEKQHAAAVAVFKYHTNVHMLEELKNFLDQREITSENIGEIRRAACVPWASHWNAVVRDLTAERENKPRKDTRYPEAPMVTL